MKLSPNMKKPLSFYSIDWLQLFCHCTLTKEGVPNVQEEMLSPNQDRNGYHRTYKLVKAKEYTHGYTWHRCVMWKDFTIANISACPSSSLHDQTGCSVKLSNAILYIYDWYWILCDILDTLKWQPQNISRIDLCCDQNYFLNGLHPETFIRSYTSKKNSYIRVGRKANDFALYAHKDIGGVSYNSIRWGSRQSGVSVYLYNKTKELNEQKDKPYIRKCWQECGLHLSKDVWRVEISITSQGTGLKDITSMMLHTLFVDDLKTSEAIKTIFQTYAQKYFHFKKIIQGKRKKDMPDFPLLSTENTSVYRPYTQKQSLQSGRTEKIVSNRLEEMREYLINMDTTFDPKVEEINHIDKVLLYYNQLYYSKKTSSTRERGNRRTLTKAIMQSLDLRSQIDRLHDSTEVRDHISYYSQIAESIARKIVARNLLAGKSSTPMKSEQRSKTNN